jgi:fatty acid desaturase
MTSPPALSRALNLDGRPAGLPEPGRGSDFAPLLQAVRGSGLLRLRRGHYTATITADLVAFAATWAALLFVGTTWWALLLAVPAAIFTTRLIFIGHDLGHSQIARTRPVNEWLGRLVGDVLLGVSCRWWVDKHSKHHANPNHVGKDPDVNPGVLCWTPEQAEDRRRDIGVWMARNQGWMYFVLLTLQGMHLRVAGFHKARRVRDTIPLALSLAAYLGLLLVALGPVRAGVFLLVHQALLGLHLGCAFAPNHKGMAMPPAGSRWDFFRKQVLTSRNVTGGRVVDWFLGGLNYQIEHHLFPSMPRPNLRFAQNLVRSHCLSLGVPYIEASLRASLMLTVRHLHGVGAARRA